jgi:DNA-binding NtrC family response regulator
MNSECASKTPPPAAILLADDNEELRETNAQLLRYEGHSVSAFDPLKPDPALLACHYDVAITDMVMPGIDGFGLREKVIRHSPFTQFIIITAHATREMLDKAIDLGFCSFLTKPFSADQLRYAVMGALRLLALTRAVKYCEMNEKTARIGFVGTSKPMILAKSKIQELAPLEIPVLITGESGTGKEVAARCIHECSGRSGGRFTAINCAGLSPGLIESELFGHAQGAFTGASHTRHGYFEVSDGGTLFLDEIGDLPLDLQSRLLRVLDTGEYNRVGDSVVRKADVRAICATNRNIARMVKEGSFREDLFYRISGGVIELDPLRNRREDILALARHFLPNEFFAIAPDALELLVGFDWPGNVRQLKMAMQRLSAMALGRIITRDHVVRVLGTGGGGKNETAGNEGPQTYGNFKRNALFGAEKKYFQGLMDSSRGNIADAARTAGIDRKNFYGKLKKFGMKP